MQSILNGTANPRTDTIEHIAEKLCINPISLLTPPSDLTQCDASCLTRDQQQELAQLFRRMCEQLEDAYE